MKRILCPTDFSDTAQNAIVYAAQLAKGADAHLTLLNVQLDLAPVEPAPGKTATLYAVSQRLEAEASGVREIFKISCDSIIDSSDHKLSTAIDREAHVYDLIVMGSNGADDLHQFFSGSKTYNTMVKTNTPVLMIPGGYEYSETRSVVYAHDSFHERTLPIGPLIDFVHALKARITVLQILERPTRAAEDEELAKFENSTKNLFADDVELRFRTIRDENVAQAIHEYFLRSGGDVLALSAKHRNIVHRFFHKSVIKHITGLADYPVFVFH